MRTRSADLLRMLDLLNKAIGLLLVVNTDHSGRTVRIGRDDRSGHADCTQTEQPVKAVETA